MTTGRPALLVDDLAAGYGRIPVVHDVSLELHAGELACLVGRNGAGKSTLLAAIAGRRHSKGRGRVHLLEEDLSRSSPSRVFRHRLALVPEGHRVFPDLTVRENLMLGRSRRIRAPGIRFEDVYGLFPILEEFAGRPAGRLSGGQQQMLAIAQALMSDPIALLLDEPSSGLAPVVVEAIYAAVDALCRGGKAVLIVEQNLERALGAAETIHVMDAGRIVLRGPVRDFRNDSRIAEIVLGTGGHRP